MVTEIDIVIVDSITVGCEITLGVLRSHASLENLDYAHSGHTGFASSADLALKLSKDNFGWVIADNTYNPAYTYSVGDTVYYDGYLYTCDVAVPTPEPFDYSKWSKITLERLIWYKQDKLTAGTGISITGNVISATGGGSSGFGFIEVSAASGRLTAAQLAEITGNEVCFLKYGTKYYAMTEKGTHGASFSPLTPGLELKEGEIWSTYAGVGLSTGDYSIGDLSVVVGEGRATTVIETGALVKKRYNQLSGYSIVFCYGYRDALSAPNQFMFAFMPDQLQVDGEDLQFYAIAGPSNWEYPIRVKRNSDGYVYWWSAYDYGGNTTFYVTKIVGVK